MTVRTDARKATNLMLPADLVASVDAVAGPRVRSRFIEEATREALHRERLRSMHARVAGALSSSDYPHWATADDVQSWVRASRAEVAEPPASGGLALGGAASR